MLRAIEAGLAVREPQHFFLWTQGQFQTLLPHRIMVALQFDADDRVLRIECPQLQDGAGLRHLADPEHGLALRLARHWRSTAPLPAWSGALALAPFQLALGQMPHVLVHGTERLGGGSSVFVLFGMPQQPGLRQAYFLELLLPYLHLNLQRLGPRAGRPGTRPISAREAEVLRWVGEGKSNGEVGRILGISAWTVKNHLQRMYKMLGVSNRTQAVARAMALRLLDRA